MTITEKQLREKIVALIETICPTAKVFRRNVLTADRAKWAGLFRHESNGQTVTHGWIVRRAKVESDDSESYERHTFEILGFYGFAFGSASANSEDEWQTVIDDLREAFDARRELDLEEVADVNHHGLQFPAIGLIRVGENEFLHFAGGRLQVDVCPC